MSAIARYFKHRGLRVLGYDKTETSLTKQLEAEGIEIHYDDTGSGVQSFSLDREKTLVVLTPAIPKDHGEWQWFREMEFSIRKRSQVLGVISEQHKTIGVAGTHGKTTTSTLVAHILKQSHLDCNAFLGGISSNYNSNLLIHPGGAMSTEQIMVVEADEFDRSFLTLHPFLSIITSTDADHLDIYGEHDALKQSFLDYSNKLVSGGTQIIKKELELTSLLTVPYKTYSVKQQANFFAENIRILNGDYYFDLHVEEHVIENLKLGMPGLHNVENAVAASAACLLLGVTEQELRTALESFRGVKRRFEYIIKNETQVFIDDYAHHPEELRAIISSVKSMYKDKKVTVAFQPHLYSRTRDFADAFAESLSLADEVFLLDIYPARELPIPGVTSKIIFDHISASKKMLSKEQLLKEVEQARPEVFCTLGAGDIDVLVQPLAQILNRRA